MQGTHRPSFHARDPPQNRGQFGRTMRGQFGRPLTPCVTSSGVHRGGRHRNDVRGIWGRCCVVRYHSSLPRGWAWWLTVARPTPRQRLTSTGRIRRATASQISVRRAALTGRARPGPPVAGRRSRPSGAPPPPMRRACVAGPNIARQTTAPPHRFPALSSVKGPNTRKVWGGW